MDPLFNHDVANWITKSMLNMDPDEAEMFGRFFVYDVHKADIENNRRTIDRHTEDIVKSLINDLPEEIRKDFDTPWEKEFQQEQPRDKAGRWRKIKVSGPTFEFGSGKAKIDTTTALNNVGKPASAFSERWTERRPGDASTNERTYRRVEAGARLLGAVPGKHAQTASAVGQFAGQFGPEAEKVVGPAARRAAYRYRGTERNPDARLQGFVRQQEATELKRLNSDADFRRRGGATQLTPEQRMAVSEDAAAAYLYSRLPKKSLSSLQVASGKLPPSEGVIISRDGEIVTQAVGYNEDHYLPFNLKNLKGLQGGAYVRTRSTGGLTTEDIYTGLVAGARSVTVVSRSGVFTLDFEDDLRGGRRYSDKARQMIGRYAQTLDAVQSKQVSRRGLTPDEKAEIREEVETETQGMGYKAHEVEAMIKERENEYSKQPHLTSSELDSVKRKALEATESYKGVKTEGTERMPDDPKKRYQAYYGMFMDEVMEEKAKRMYQLDADGYDAAQQALREQFPYFVADVRVKRVPGEDKAEDKGYVRPNYNRPKAVKAGYFDEEINGRGKFPASELHYQNYSHGAGGRTAASSEGAPTPSMDRKNREGALKESREKIRFEEMRKTALKSGADASVKFAAMERAENAGAYPQLKKYAGNNDLNLFSAQDITALIEEIKGIHGMVYGIEENRKKYSAEAQILDDAVKGIDRADVQMKSRVAFDEKKWTPGTVSPYPQKFRDNDPAHRTNEDPIAYQKAWNHLLSTKKMGDLLNEHLSDQQLQALEKKYGDLYAATLEWKDAKSAGQETFAAEQKIQNAMQRAGYDDRTILAFDDRMASENGPKEIERLSEMARTRALGIVEARSIMANSEGKLLQKPAEKAENEPIKGEVIHGSVSVHAETVRASKSREPQHLHKALDELADALAGTDRDAIKSALRNLPPEDQERFKSTVKNRLSEL